MSIKTHSIGNQVLCDNCNTDYTTSDLSGGILFGSKAICPICTPEIEYNINKYGEQRFINDRCPKDKSFADWVRDDLRDGKPGTINVLTGDDADALLNGKIKVIKTSILDGKEHSMNLNISLEKLKEWDNTPRHIRPLIQNVFPELNNDEREFLSSGITPEEWNKTFPIQD